MPAKINLVNERYGRLLVLREAESCEKAHARWICLCECGQERIASSDSLRRGRVRSCGCLLRDSITQRNRSPEARERRAVRNRTHGKTHTPTYQIWKSMRARCRNPLQRAWKDYGGRGITVCSHWDSYENFLADMGERPEGLSLDRRDNDGNYEPSNCRWATPGEQAQNRRPAGAYR